MISKEDMRDQNKDQAYFNQWIDFTQESITKNFGAVENFPRIEGRSSKASRICKDAFELCVMRYGRGDAIGDLRKSVWQWVEARELAVRMFSQLPPDLKDVRLMYEKLTLDGVYNGLTMMAFARALKFDQEEMKRLIDAVGHSGQDALIDEAARALVEEQRIAANACMYPKVYEPLLDVWRSPTPEQPAKLLAFSKVWKKKIKPIYWSDNLSGAEGAYFGYWCFDIALAAIALKLPDEPLRGNAYYPGDLVDAARSK